MKTNILRTMVITLFITIMTSTFVFADSKNWISAEDQKKH
jgi:hypothetical protein